MSGTDAKTEWTGGCLCGAVRYTIAGGRPSPISLCHCSQCRRQHSHVGAYTSFPQAWLTVADADGALAWFQSSDQARRGFCARCGSGLFWQPLDGGDMDLAAGTLDEPTGLVADRHIYVTSKADWETIGRDGLHQLETSDPAMKTWTPD